MTQLKPTLPYLLIIAAGYFLLPWIKYGYSFFLIPFWVFGIALIFGLKNRLRWNYGVFALLAAALFLPIVLIYLNYTAFYLIPVFGVVALAGSLTGRLFMMKVP